MLTSFEVLQMYFEHLRVVYEACLVMSYLQCMSCSERTPHVHPRSGGVEERDYEDTVSIRYEAFENQRGTSSLGSEC